MVGRPIDTASIPTVENSAPIMSVASENSSLSDLLALTAHFFHESSFKKILESGARGCVFILYSISVISFDASETSSSTLRHILTSPGRAINIIGFLFCFLYEALYSQTHLNRNAGATVISRSGQNSRSGLIKAEPMTAIVCGMTPARCSAVVGLVLMAEEEKP